MSFAGKIGKRHNAASFGNDRWQYIIIKYDPQWIWNGPISANYRQFSLMFILCFFFMSFKMKDVFHSKLRKTLVSISFIPASNFPEESTYLQSAVFGSESWPKCATWIFFFQLANCQFPFLFSFFILAVWKCFFSFGIKVLNRHPNNLHVNSRGECLASNFRARARLQFSMNFNFKAYFAGSEFKFQS